jgi:hypothetical protein
VSVFFGQHNGDDPLGDRWIGRVRRVVGQGFVEIIDLKKDHLAVGFERSEVVFAIRIVGLAKVVVDGNGLDDPATASGPRAAMPVVITA